VAITQHWRQTHEDARGDGGDAGCARSWRPTQGTPDRRRSPNTTQVGRGTPSTHPKTTVKAGSGTELQQRAIENAAEEAG